MSYMFRDATKFNQPLDNCDVSNVVNTDDMFDEATAYSYGELK